MSELNAKYHTAKLTEKIWKVEGQLNYAIFVYTSTAATLLLFTRRERGS